MPGRISLGDVSGGALSSLDAAIGVTDINGDNPANDLVIRDSNDNIVFRYDGSAGAWVPGKFAFEDSTADPSANGELQRNGADLKAYSGGAVRNLSDVGAGALTDSGTDTDGGDDYALPNAADNIDLQGDGAIQNADSITTDDHNNVQWVEPGDDLQAAIDSVDRTGDSWPVASGVVRLTPSTSEDLNKFTLSGEYIVRENVTVDIRGAMIEWTDGGPHWTLRKQATMLTGGSHQTVSGSGSVYYTESYDNGVGMTEAPEVLGFGRVEGSDLVVRAEESDGASVSNTLHEVTVQNCNEVVRFGSNGGGYVNDNVVRLRGSINPSGAASGTGILFAERSTTGSRVRENEVELQQVQSKGTGSGDLVKVDGGRFNDVYGTIADIGASVNMAIRFTSAAFDYNTLRLRWGYMRQLAPSDLMVDNSGAIGNTIVPLDRPNIYPTPDLSAWYEVDIDNTGARTTTQDP